MADRRIWPTNNIVDLAQVADAFGLPGGLSRTHSATQSLGDVLADILLELKRIRVGMDILADAESTELTTDDF